jgi:hypothetical protein
MCVLKGLQRSSRIGTDPIRTMTAGMLAAIKGGIAPSTLVRPLPAMVVAPLPLHRKANVSGIFAQRESRSLRRGADGADGLAEARPRG